MSEEKKHYISDRNMRAEQGAGIRRSHWEIENGLHWAMDIVFQEGLSLTNSGQGVENLSVLRRMALNLFNGKEKKGAGVAAKRRKAAWYDRYTVELFALFISKPADYVKYF